MPVYTMLFGKELPFLCREVVFLIFGKMGKINL